MMGILVILLMASMVVGIIFLSHTTSDSQATRKKYLEEMTRFLHGRLEPSEEYENAYKIIFKHRGIEFVYHDIRDDLMENRFYQKGHLSTKMPFNLLLNFVEMQRSSLMSSGHSTRGVTVPKKLQEFAIFSNNPTKANDLLSDPDILKVFLKYKNIDSRGHPVMSLELKGQIALLVFQSPGEDLRPNLLDLQYSPQSIESHLEDMVILMNKLEAIKDIG